ncbi:hypothetical protein BvCmsF63A_02174 [Escherichia coli]|nr:hypothetical protein BvCmsF63A_02174 [Escherichia coli]
MNKLSTWININSISKKLVRNNITAFIISDGDVSGYVWVLRWISRKSNGYAKISCIIVVTINECVTHTQHTYYNKYIRYYVIFNNCSL